MTDWRPIQTAPENTVVLTRIKDDVSGEERNVQRLIRKGNLWFLPDMSMYVYYQPTHWQLQI